MPTSSGTDAPASDSVGASATGSVWRAVTCSGERPLAVAVRTKSASTTSGSDARVIRRHMAASGAPATSHGTTSAFSHVSGSSVKGTYVLGATIPIGIGPPTDGPNTRMISIPTT